MQRILIDVDGVLADAVSHAGLAHAEVTSYNHPGLLEALKRPGFAADQPEYDGAVEGIRALGADVVFVTAPYQWNQTWAHDREGWLRERFPAAPVVHTAHKYLVKGDMLVDDNPEHLRAWVKANPYGIAILWSRPWNENDTGPWARTDSWLALRVLVEALTR